MVLCGPSGPKWFLVANSDPNHWSEWSKLELRYLMGCSREIPEGYFLGHPVETHQHCCKDKNAEEQKRAVRRVIWLLAPSQTHFTRVKEVKLLHPVIKAPFLVFVF